jgi:putative transposase
LLVLTAGGLSIPAIGLRTKSAAPASSAKRKAECLDLLVRAAMRFAELVAGHLFTRKSMTRIDKPPDVNPSRPRPRPLDTQLELKYA